MGYVAYYRVSTKRQGESGLGLDGQRAIVAHFAGGSDLVAEYTEVLSGGKGLKQRAVLAEAVSLCIEGGHTLIVAKVDRLSRKTEHALAIYSQLEGRLVSCDVPNLDKFTLTIFMAIADRERELIGIRTKSALAQAKAKGTQLGTAENMTTSGRVAGNMANQQLALEGYRLVYGYVSTLRGQGLSLAAIANKLNSEGHVTRHGKQFASATVKRILDRGGK